MRFPPDDGYVSRLAMSLDAALEIFYYVDEMAKGDFLGEFEHIVLLSVLRLGDGAHSAMIRTEIENVTGRSSAIGAVHATLERLERKGYVSSWLGQPTAERGGKAKRHFKIEAAGVSVLKSARSALDKLHAGVSLRTLST